MTAPKPTIAIIIPGGIGTGKNNIGVPVLEQIVRLLSADFSITVFQLYKTNQNYKAEGFELIDIHSSNPLIRIIKFLFVFGKRQQRRKFSVVHGFWAMPAGFLAVLTGKIFSIKSMVSLQGGDAIALPEISYGQLQKWFSRRLVLWTLHQTDELISPTRYLIDNLADVGFQRKKIHYISLGVDMNLFKYHEKRLNPPVQFLHVANLHPVKDQTTLLKAFQIITSQLHCNLTIVGEGILEKQVKSLAKQLGLKDRIVFREPVSNEALAALYYEADILLHTSLSEGHPIVVEEAMSCGVVVCGTRVGLLYDLPDCCLSVDIKDYKSLAEETLKLIADPQRMNTLRQRAYQWASRHSIRWTLEKLTESYKS